LCKQFTAQKDEVIAVVTTTSDWRIGMTIVDEDGICVSAPKQDPYRI
jgi:hypothetical protein